MGFDGESDNKGYINTYTLMRILTLSVLTYLCVPMQYNAIKFHYLKSYDSIDII